LNRTWISRLGAVLARGAFNALRDRMDPRKHNGGVFAGLNGVVVKSHGGTDELGFATAIDVAIEMVRNGLVKKIAEDVAAMNAIIMEPAAQVAE
jgi:phosphate acyltransferase